MLTQLLSTEVWYKYVLRLTTMTKNEEKIVQRL